MENNAPVFRHTKRLFFLLPTLIKLIQQRRMVDLVNKAFRLWRRAGLIGMWHQIERMGYTNLGYTDWIKQYDTLNDADRDAIRSHITRFSYRPLISVLMPTYNSPEKWLRHAIESVRNQLYPDWELCIADDASTQPHVRTVLEEYKRLDSRIRVIFRESNGHISVASNSTLQIASGDFVALLDHDDELPEHALYMVASTLNDKPDLDLIYSDEDKIDEQGHRFDPYFKPDWNPDLLTGQNMVSHLGVYRTALVRSIDGFREGYEGSQDWDLALRIGEIIPPSHIYHIPHVLYHWRAIPGSAAINPDEKNYVSQASLLAVQDHIQRQGCNATVEPAFSSFVRVLYALPNPAPMVSILLVSKNTSTEELLRNTSYPSLEILSQSDNDPNVSVTQRQLESSNSNAEWFNLAANKALGSILCFLDTGCLPQGDNWLVELVSHLLRDEIGAACPLMLGTDGYMCGAQTVLYYDPDNKTIAWNYYSGSTKEEKGMKGRAALPQNLSILPSGCLVIRTATFRELGGFNTKEFSADLYGFDFCLRLIEAGYRNLWSPYSHMTVLSESQSFSHDREIQLFQERWKNYFNHDPAHNPNLACGISWPIPAFPPRIIKPWKKM